MQSVGLLSSTFRGRKCTPDGGFVDGDDLHPPSNIQKMSAGIPLTDADREPWLRAIRERSVKELEALEDRTKEQQSVKALVVGCSALKRHYRNILRGDPENNEDSQQKKHLTYFLFIDGPKEVLFDRMGKRTGHFMKASMLESQLKTLERPTEDENAIVVSRAKM